MRKDLKSQKMYLPESARKSKAQLQFKLKGLHGKKGIRPRPNYECIQRKLYQKKPIHAF